RPLDDFPGGTLGKRERAAFLVSDRCGWDIVPPTVFRDTGPFGPGMTQLWIDLDPEADVIAMVNGDDPRLRTMAAFDAAVNNADRKGGHILPTPDGHVYGVDHGICFAAEPKLRTILWGWRGQPLAEPELALLQRTRAALADGADGAGVLGGELRPLLSRAEVRALRHRVDALLASGCFPLPDPYRMVIPWPPF
ncbi:MAG TPA: SCO1664 family protein, partial [Candidatus Saccharimonadales bacterium]|nr:SCO1664 family protein [Candidatus Saccharimonadales bacterium]